MAYIGKTPTVGSFIKLDDISTSSTNSYTMQHNSVNFSPESANHMLVSLNGVIQAPNTSFSISGSTITFLPSSGTLSSSDSIDFIMVYGNVLDVGVASSVADSAITKGKLNLISDSSSAGLTVKGDGSSENGTIALNCSSNSHAVKLSSPSHASGQSYEMILPATNITAGKFLKVDSVSGSGATGIGQLSFADAGGGTMTPAFEAKLSAVQNVSDNTDTKLQANTETFDTDNAYDNSSNYRFTPQTAGKYFVYGNIYGDPQTASDLYYTYAFIKKNGTQIAQQAVDFRNNAMREASVFIQSVVDMNGSSDYVELFGTVNSVDGSGQRFLQFSNFGAFRIIT